MNKIYLKEQLGVLNKYQTEVIESISETLDILNGNYVKREM
ncbi:hypothetical protein [Clostridium perfringens]